VNTIPPVDLARQHQQIADKVDAAVLAVLHSGRYIGGAVVTDFELQFANYVGAAECVACNSGTDALYLALRALNIGPGDEVITSTFTFIATTETINLAGATPVFVDIDLGTFNLDLDQIEAAITPRTKAIIPVHLFGQPVDMTRLKAIAQKYRLYIIEDCAQATGAEWAGQQVGSIGDLGCFSYFPTKNLGTCGDGGSVTTHNLDWAATVRTIKEHGSRQRYYHDVVGVNSRLDSVQAAILQVKLQYLDQWNQQRQAIAERYHEFLAPLPDIQLPQAILGGRHVWNQYTILIRDRKSYDRNVGDLTWRDQIKEKLQESGVIAMVYYPIPLHLQRVYRDLNYQKGQFPAAEQAARQVLSLPIFPDLTLEEQEKVVYVLKDALS
jgi:dTDP-4-amino-4,6-dideoxygalactose transaminase